MLLSHDPLVGGPTECQVVWQRGWQSHFRIVRAGGVDVHHLARHDLANRVVAIDQVEAIQSEREGAVESFDLFRLDLAVPEQPIDRHRPRPSPWQL
jgi:hypothetical protein